MYTASQLCLLIWHILDSLSGKLISMVLPLYLWYLFVCTCLISFCLQHLSQFANYYNYLCIDPIHSPQYLPVKCKINVVLTDTSLPKVCLSHSLCAKAFIDYVIILQAVLLWCTLIRCNPVRLCTTLVPLTLLITRLVLPDLLKSSTLTRNSTLLLTRDILLLM